MRRVVAGAGARARVEEETVTDEVVEERNRLRAALEAAEALLKTEAK